MIWPDLHRICCPATFHSQDAIHKLSMTHIYIWLLKVVQMKFISIWNRSIGQNYREKWSSWLAILYLKCMLLTYARDDFNGCVRFELYHKTIHFIVSSNYRYFHVLPTEWWFPNDLIIKWKLNINLKQFWTIFFIHLCMHMHARNKSLGIHSDGGLK